jgi:hypothetical protein
VSWEKGDVLLLDVSGKYFVLLRKLTITESCCATCEGAMDRVS